MESFKWLNTEVNKTDYYRYRLTGPDGKAEDGKLFSDPQIYRKQLAELERRGTLSFPFKKVIEIRNEMNGQLIYKLTSKSMASIWPSLHAYVFPCFDSTEPTPAPPVLVSDGPDKAWDQIILVPERVALLFLSAELVTMPAEDFPPKIYTMPEVDELSGNFEPHDDDLLLEPYSMREDLLNQKSDIKSEAFLIINGVIEQDSTEKEPNLFCEHMPLHIPLAHFKILTKKNSRNNKPYLTVEQLKIFIKRAFCGKKELPKQRFNLGQRDKFLVQGVFYEFYFTYCFEYFNTMQCQPMFIKLLTDNFVGWDYRNVQSNFKPKSNNRL